MNNDGLPDLIIGSYQSAAVWYQAPNWTRRTIASLSDTESGSAVGDINADGLIDVVIGRTWYQNVGGGSSWTARTLPSSSVGTHDVVVRDVNADGRQDIIMRGETTSVVGIFLQQSPTSWQVFTVQPGIGLNGLDVADVNADARPDIVVGGVWMENPGGNVATGTWLAHSFASSWNQYAAVKVEDLDQDGRMDIVLSVSEAVGKLSWFKGPTDPRSTNWTEQVLGSGLDHVHGFVIADFNEDGRKDVIASEYAGSGRLLMYLRTSTGSWQATNLGNDLLHNIKGADLGNDGDIDIFGVYAFGIAPVIVYENTTP